MNTPFIVCGNPGAGKSSYAAVLAAERRAALVDIDTVTERMVRIALQESGRDVDDRDSPYFKDAYRSPVYETLFDIAQENVKHIDTVIVGPFTREIKDASWPEYLSARLGAKIEVHYVRCDPIERRKRIQTRGNPRDAAKLRNWEEYLRYYGPEEPPVFGHVTVDTSGKNV